MKERERETSQRWCVAGSARACVCVCVCVCEDFERGEKRIQKVEKRRTLKITNTHHVYCVYPSVCMHVRGHLCAKLFPHALRNNNMQAATHYATMLETDYVSKPKFIENFWCDFCAILRPELRKKVRVFGVCACPFHSKEQGEHDERGFE